MFVTKLALAALLRILNPGDHRYTLQEMVADNPYTLRDLEYALDSKHSTCTCTCTCDKEL